MSQAVLFFILFQGKRNNTSEKGQAFNKNHQGHNSSRGENIWSQSVMFPFRIMFYSTYNYLFPNYEVMPVLKPATQKGGNMAQSRGGLSIWYILSLGPTHELTLKTFWALKDAQRWIVGQGAVCSPWPSLIPLILTPMNFPETKDLISNLRILIVYVTWAIFSSVTQVVY